MAAHHLKENIKTLLLDYDNTLHDSDSLFTTRLNGLFGLDGRELWDFYLFKIHRGIVHKRFPARHDDPEFHCKLVFEHLGRPYDEVTAKTFIERYVEAEEATWSDPNFFPDTFHFLNHISERPYNLCLSTGVHAKEKAAALDKYGSRRYFNHVFGEDSIGYIKLNPEYYKEVLRLSASRAEETASIGDTLTTDIAPAKALGITTIWINKRGSEPPNDPRWRPDHEVKNLSEILIHL